MSRTHDEHHRIGTLLGIPSCCVEQWISELPPPGTVIRREDGQGVRRGSICTHMRTDEEVELLVSLGVPAAAFLDRGARYVPCDECRAVAHARASRVNEGTDPILDIVATT